MPSLTQLKYLISLHKHRHFGRAAEECHVSQPSLSAQIQLLEEELGITAFDRSKKPVLVTAEGIEAVRIAKQVLSTHRELFEIQSSGKAPSGELQLGVIPTLAPYLVPLFLENFSKKYPKVKLVINEYQTHQLITKLYDDELDAALMVTPLHDKRLIERVLFFEPFHVFTAPSHPLYKKKRLKDLDLDAESVWLLDEGHCFRNQVIRLCSLDRRKDVLENVSFSSGNLETLINLIRRGHGYTLLPHLALISLSKSEKEKNIKYFTYPMPSREVSLVHSRSFLKSSILDALEGEVIAALPPGVKSLKKSKAEVIEI